MKLLSVIDWRACVRVADGALLRVVPTDTVSNRLRVRFPVSAAGFHYSSAHRRGLSPSTQ
jgi:hypothetical protein